MKDYLLSEMIEICKKQEDCEQCPFWEIGDNCVYRLKDVGVEPRDMIELPSKQKRICVNKDIVFDVYLRDVFGNVSCITYTDEKRADELVKELKDELKEGNK